MAVASSAFPAVGDGCAFSFGHQVCQHLSRLLVVDDSADREQDVDGFAPAAGTVGTAPVLPIFRLIVALIAQIKESREPVGGGKDHVASIPSVPSVRASTRDEHFPTEAAAPVAAAAGLYCNLDFVDEHGKPFYEMPERTAPRGTPPGSKPFREPLGASML